MANKSTKKASEKRSARKTGVKKAPRNELLFESLDDFKEQIPKLRRNKQLHPQTLINLSCILNKSFPGDHITSETNVDGGRADAHFYKLKEGKIIHIEIFGSVGQVVQDLRLLEQSKADFLIAIIIDPEIDAKVANTFHQKRPYPDPIQFFNLSDFYLQSQIPDTIKRIYEIIDAQRPGHKQGIKNNQETTNIVTIQGILQTSAPDAWNWLDGLKEQYVYKQDVLLRIELYTSQEDDERYEEVQKKFREQGIPGDDAARDIIKKEYNSLCSWAADYPDPWFKIRTAEVYYGNSIIKKYLVQSCDGDRIVIVVPRLASGAIREEPIKLNISPLEYNLSRILTCCGSNRRIPDYEARFPHSRIVVPDNSKQLLQVQLEKPSKYCLPTTCSHCGETFQGPCIVLGDIDRFLRCPKCGKETKIT